MTTRGTVYSDTWRPPMVCTQFTRYAAVAAGEGPEEVCQQLIHTRARPERAPAHEQMRHNPGHRIQLAGLAPVMGPDDGVHLVEGRGAKLRGREAARVGMRFELGEQLPDQPEALAPEGSAGGPSPFPVGRRRVAP